MTDLLAVGVTKKGFGFTYDNVKLYVISPCCRFPVKFAESTGNVDYVCGKCEKLYLGSDIDGAEHWLPEVYLTNFKDEDKGKIKAWVRAWTGQSDVKIIVEGI